MADKKIDDTFKETNLNIASKNLSKPMLIKIAIGLLVLFISAGAGYLFFMSSAQSSSEEATTDINEETISLADPIPPAPAAEPAETEGKTSTTETPPLNKENTAEDRQLLEIREQAIALKKENLQIKERLKKLESQQKPNIETAKTIVNAATPKDNTTVKKVASQPKEKINPYANLYTRDYTVLREPRREPPPEPKWGDFDPLYRGN